MARQSTATPSQFASAIMHMERRSEWRYVRIDGQRYVVLVSGNSGRVYIVRADANGCECLWSQKASTPCSHRLALEIDAMEEELAEAPVSLKSLRDLYPGCAAGCGNLADGLDAFCSGCAAARERAARMAVARRRVAESM